MNWGTGIVLVLIAFIAFMGTMVGIVTKKAKVDMVVSDYYGNEIKYNGRFKALKRGQEPEMKPKLQWELEKAMLEIRFEGLQPDSGFLCHLYRPSGSGYDMHLRSQDSVLHIDMSQSPPGKWIVKVDWAHQGEAAALETQLML